MARYRKKLKRNRKKLKRNRFIGSEQVYSTKKFLVRVDVYTGKDGVSRIAKRYIRKSPRAYRELRESKA